MTTNVIIEEQIVEEKINLADMAQKALHLSLGAVALAQEEVMALFEKAQKELKARLEQTQGDASGLVDKMVERGATGEEARPQTRQRFCG